MVQLLKQSTAVTIKLGPFVDSGDGNTDETTLTLSQADFRLSKNGGDMAQKNEATSATHDEIGWYDVPLNTTDTNTLGSLIVMAHESGALPVWREFLVVPANVYDSLVSGSDYLQADVVQLAGVTQSLTDLKDFADDGYDPSTNKVQGVVLVDTLTTYTGNTPQTGDSYAIVASGTHGNAALKTLIDTVDDLLDTEVAAIKAKTDNLPSDPADASDIATAFAAVPAAVWSATTSGWSSGQMGEVLVYAGDSLSSILDVTAKIDTALELDGLVYRFTTNALEQGPSGSGLDAAGVRAAVGLASANLDTQLSTIDDLLDTEVAAIKAKTDLISEIYHADIDLRIDDANDRDDYRVIWWKDGARITSAITLPTIQVIKQDNSDLIAETAMTANSYTFTYRAEDAERLTPGQSVEVLVTATINGGTRTFSAVLGRDSE